MLTIKQITENTEAVLRGLEKKHFKNAKETIDANSIHALSAVLLDGDSGRVLYEKEGECKRANASTTKIMIGKGKRDAAVKDAVVRNGAVYLAALGGAGALMAKSVQTLEVIAWPDLGCEAVRRLTVQDMPLTVVLDAHGGDLYEAGPAAYLATR